MEVAATTSGARATRSSRRRHAAGRSGEGRVSRWWLLVGGLLSVAAVVIESFGKMAFDTKTDLVTNPVALFTNLWNLWDPLPWFGTIRNQYQGYAFPTDAFFIVGHYLGIPAWLTQRLWMAAFLTAAFWGAVRLAEALGLGSRPTRLVAGFTYALWPVFSILLGPNTASIGPEMLIPWAVLPLVKGAQRGSPVRAAALSALAVLFMGGANAANTFDALIPAALFLLTREKGPRRSSLIRWWVACVAMATFWWVIPLLFLGQYGFNWLPYVEQAVTTTSTSSATTALLGTNDWTSYLRVGGEAWEQAGWVCATAWTLICSAGCVAAAGLYGLARRRLPERRWLLSMFVVGVVATTAGYWGPLGGPLTRHIAPLLNGPLVPFRNIYKFEAVVTLAVALAAAHVFEVAWQRRPSISWRLPTMLVAVTCLLGLSTPYLLGRSVPGNSFGHIPRYWYAAAKYLQEHSPRSPVLVLPADAHGQYDWGWSIDNPLESIASSPWVDREVTPYGGPASERMLDGLDEAIETGTYSSGFDEALARAGIRYVLVQNDLEWQLSDDPSPESVHIFLALEHLKLVNPGWGKLIATETGSGPTLQPHRSETVVKYHPVQIFEAPLPSSVVNVYPKDHTALVSGGPEAVEQLLNAGLLGPEEGAVLAGDLKGPYDGPEWLVTDTLRRTPTNFALPNDNYGFTYTAHQLQVPTARFPGGRAPPSQMLPFPGVQHETVAVFTGAASVTASSSGSYEFELPEYNPANVFDNDSSTGWVAASPYGSDGQWVEVDLDHPTDLTGTTINLIDAPGRPVPTELAVSTNRGTVVDHVSPTSTSQRLRVPAGQANWLRVTFEAVDGQQLGGSCAGIRSIDIPGLSIQDYLKPPEEPVGFGANSSVFSFATQQVNPTSILRSAPEPVMARQFSLQSSTKLELSGQATPVAGAALDSVISPSSSMHISASSTFDNLPAVRPQNLLDFEGIGKTLKAPPNFWEAGGRDATITLSWASDVKLTTLQLYMAPKSAGVANPTQVRLTSAAGTRTIDVPPGEAPTLTFPALDTDRVQISFPSVADRYVINGLGRKSLAPVGLAEIDFEQLKVAYSAHDAYEIPQPSTKASFDEPCSAGDSITVDGQSQPISIHGTYHDLLDEAPLNISSCKRGFSLDLAAGTHHLVAGNEPDPFLVSALTLRGKPKGPVAAPSPIRSVSILKWASESRTIRIASGAASYVELHQNFDKGWVASLDGKALTPIILDGWQQGFLVPAGAGGLIKMTFKPEGRYLLGLGVGALGVLLLILLLFGVGGFLRRRHDLDPVGSNERAVAGWVTLLLATLAVALVAGPLALLVPVLAVIRRRWPFAVPWVAAVAMISAAAVAAWNPGFGAETQTGSFSPAAQALAVVAIAAVLAPVARWGKGRQRGNRTVRSPT
ncbi:MAG: alpha-(1-_3)-arabinofuranosyltransferase domain-containing protein [Acidimicrobiales bacterium]